MSFSRKASANVVPLLSRLVLAAAFIPAGWDKIMGEPMVYEGQDALTLQKLGIGDPAGSAATLAGEGQDPLGFYQQDVETGRLRDRVGGKKDQPADPAEGPEPAPAPRWRPKTPPTPAETTPATPPEQPVEEQPAPEPEPLPKPPPPKPEPKPQPKPEPPKPEPKLEPPAETQQVDATPVKARRLYRVALMLDEAGWPRKLKPGWMAWAAAGAEAIGGALILVGLFSRVWGLGLAITMGFAFWLTSFAGVSEYGFFSLPIPEFNRAFAQLGLFALAVGVMLTGAGGMSLDRALFRGGGDDAEEHLLHLG